MTQFPKSLAQCADLYYETRVRRLELQKEVDDLKAKESALRDHLIDSLPKSDATGVAGSVCSVKVVIKTTPQVNDWDALYRYVSRTKAWDMLQRRVSDAAVKARWEAGKAIPGVEAFQYADLSVSKVK